MTLKERLKYLLKNEGIKQKDLALKLNTSPQTVNNWLKRDSISREAAQNIGGLFGYSLDWLLNGVGEPKIKDFQASKEAVEQYFNELKNNPEYEKSRIYFITENHPSKDKVKVPFVEDIELIPNDISALKADSNNTIKFKKSVLIRNGIATDGSTIVCFPFKGNSMEPRLPDGSHVAIDTSKKDIIDGRIYVIEQDGLKRLKILYRRPGGKILIRSYNREEHEDEETDEDKLSVIGCLIWYSVMIKY